MLSPESPSLCKEETKIFDKQNEKKTSCIIEGQKGEAKNKRSP